MKCERAVELLTQSAEGAGNEHWVAAEHADTCGDCRAAVAAVHALRLARLAPLPDPETGALERAVVAATSRREPEVRSRRGFWAGLCIGAAMAASIAIAAFIVVREPVDGASVPRLVLEVDETRDVSISLTAAEAMADAEIRVLVSGAIGLGGYEDQRELRWRTSLEPGINQLTLPVVATGVGGGQVLVEVHHGGKRRTFVVDVTAAG